MSKPNEQPRVVPGNWYAELDGHERIIGVGEPLRNRSQTWVWLDSRGAIGDSNAKTRLKLIAPVPSSAEAAAMREVCEKADALRRYVGTANSPEFGRLIADVAKASAKLDAVKGGG